MKPNIAPAKRKLNPSFLESNTNFISVTDIMETLVRYFAK